MWGPYLIAGLVVSALGLALGVLALRGDPARGRRRCSKCWYDMGGTQGLTCPECGRTARHDRELSRTRRRKRRIAAAIVLVAAGQLGWLEARVRRGGWLAAVPTEVLILGMPWVPEWWLAGGARAAEDWSLRGRLFGGRASPWHLRWSRARAAAWLRSADDPRDLLARLDALVGVRGGRASVVVMADPEVVAGVCLRMGVAAHDAGDTAAGQDLLSMAMSHGQSREQHAMAGEPESYFGPLVDGAAPDIVGLIRRAPDHGLASVLAAGDGRPEVVDCLLDLLDVRSIHATHVLGVLARRHPHVLSRLAAILGDPLDARRASLVEIAHAWNRRTDMPSELRAAVLGMVESDNPAEAHAALRVAWIVEPYSCDGAIMRGLELIGEHPDMAREVAWTLAGNYEFDLPRFEPLVRSLQGSPDPRIQRAAGVLTPEALEENRRSTRHRLELLESVPPAS